ncbi:MAG TPA: peptidylprolyl isomerase [Candidatus Kapabacteria bacterium]|nr:peptidylprolyl isomerase [Candidatus Kapabacteria bacterium]
MNKIKCIVIICFLFSLQSLYSQPKKGDALDKIVAVVGDEAITDSDVKGRISFLVQQDPKTNPNDPKFYNQVLQTIIDEKLIIIKAKEDSIEVSDDEIEERWQLFLQQSLAQLGSEQRIEQVYGMSIPRMRNEFREEIRNRLLSSKIIEKEFGQLTVSNSELKTFFEQYKDSLPEVPVSASLYRIVRNVESLNKNKEDVFRLALRVRDSIITGGNFEDFAKRYSDDKQTGAEGGDLGWIAKGKFLPELEKYAFTMLPGEISLPIETPLGYHIIKLRDKRKDEVLLNHILFKIGQSDDDKQRVKNFLDSLRLQIKSLDDFKKFAQKFSDDNDTRGFGGYIGNVPLDQLPDLVKEVIEKLQDGQISEVLPYSTSSNKTAYQLIYKEKMIPAHKASLETDRDLIEQQAIQYKRMQEYSKWIAKLRQEIYWEIIN